MSAATVLRCPGCGDETSAGDRFCEACGEQLVTALATDADATDPAAERAVASEQERAAGVCRSCGGVVGEDGYCQTCGTKAALARDHFDAEPAPWVAMTCDRGVRHRRNEDAGAVSADPEPSSRAVLVVCDGVSSSTDSDVASLAAATAAQQVLSAGRARGIGTPDSQTAAIVARLEAAADAAREAVVASTAADSPDPASCTFVAAVVEDGRIVAGSVGDSRAYWLPDRGEGVALTVDDSMAAELIARGVPREEAESGPQAHAITRWLGVDAPEHTPRTRTQDIDSDGWLLVCSDGLWNYCSEARDLAGLVRRTAAEHDGRPLATTAALVDWANAQGGRDNITVALARLTSGRT
ncbi:PP2C family protein-serine/threonine phosphatase [Luteipulveratus flavus]|uniref:Serine/threonine-protein phosphatase n=1 Tax=Luteipulveratus flavus TaxID=3031728 RepID=A0ABT6C865_9MICO|nr:PP2C family serine/threonine-protein phosphatase [Luteipulveratus sp. YIM 133296]MDF8264477.1 serine/threonine-protein phosphatase [Luteipulveratus sp. YIM 133296]